MGADNHPTVVPTNYEDTSSSSSDEKKLFQLWTAEECKEELLPTFVYIQAEDLEDAEIKGLLVAVAFGAYCECQYEVRPVELYV